MCRFRTQLEGRTMTFEDLEKYGFTDEHGHKLENCVEYIELQESYHTLVRHHKLDKRTHSDEELKDAIIEGVTKYAHWKDGVQYVGTCGKTLRQAVEEIRNG